jgi:glutaredoxin
MGEPLRVFWQPGCSSCLKAKEFLAGHGFSYESVNMLASAQGLADLKALGAKSVPVVSRGRDFVFAQNLSDLAAFVGVEREARVLTRTDLVAKIDRVLAVAQALAPQLPDETLATKLPGRDRTYLDLAYHIFVIAEALLESARGGELTFDFFERLPPDDMFTGAQVASFGARVRGDVAAWWASASESLPLAMRTYYGDQSPDDLLERTAWHAAQHTRQLEAVLHGQGIRPNDRLSEADLAGLPLPDHVYDDEVPLDSNR